MHLFESIYIVIVLDEKGSSGFAQFPPTSSGNTVSRHCLFIFTYKGEKRQLCNIVFVYGDVKYLKLQFGVLLLFYKFGRNREIAEELQNMEWPCKRNNIYAICTRQYPISAIYWSRVREWCNEE